MPDPLLALLIGALLLAAGLVIFWPQRGLLPRWRARARVDDRVRTEDASSTFTNARCRGPASHPEKCCCVSGRFHRGSRPARGHAGRGPGQMWPAATMR